MSNQVPDEIRISEEETQTLDLGLKEVSVRVVKREKVIPRVITANSSAAIRHLR